MNLMENVMSVFAVVTATVEVSWLRPYQPQRRSPYHHGPSDICVYRAIPILYPGGTEIIERGIPGEEPNNGALEATRSIWSQEFGERPI